MAGNIIQCNYDDMREVSNNFARQSDAARQLLQTVQNCVSALQGGGWLGKGAESFYREMSDLVQPAMQRLGAALADASSATQRIATALEQAEREAGSLFTGADGGDSGAGGNSGTTGGDAGGGNPDPRYQPIGNTANNTVPAYMINFRDPNFNVGEFMQNLQTDGRPVLFMVHGFTEQNEAIVNRLQQASQDYSQMYNQGNGSGKPPIIIGIQWDAGIDSTTPSNYWQANANAVEYAPRFADALVQFRQFHPESQVMVNAHSLGNRLTMEALASNPNARIDRYLAVQPAVNASEFRPGGRFHDIVNSPQVGNMAATFNTQDKALWAHWATGTYRDEGSWGPLVGQFVGSGRDVALGASTDQYPGIMRISMQTGLNGKELNHHSWHDPRVMDVAANYFGLGNPNRR
ncbi:MAG: WXG100 family type VII secretion target [Aggregatilineales bacterium]